MALNFGCKSVVLVSWSGGMTLIPVGYEFAPLIGANVGSSDDTSSQ